MTETPLNGIAPADELHSHYGRAIAWLKTHWRNNPKEMVCAVGALFERIDDLEAANHVSAEALERAENRAVLAEHHVARLRIHVVTLETRLLEAEAGLPVIGGEDG